MVQEEDRQEVENHNAVNPGIAKSEILLSSIQGLLFLHLLSVLRIVSTYQVWNVQAGPEPYQEAIPYQASDNRVNDELHYKA